MKNLLSHVLLFAIVISTVWFQQTLALDSTLIDIEEPDQFTEDFRKFLDSEFQELDFYPKYHNGRLNRAGFDRMDLRYCDRIKDAHEVLNYKPSTVSVAMIGDNCEFVDSNPRVWGRAKFAIECQETLLLADEITFEETDRIVDAKGRVRIYRDEIVFVGSHLRFKLKDSRYLFQTQGSMIREILAKARGSRLWRTSGTERAEKEEKIFQSWRDTKLAEEARLTVEKKIREVWNQSDALNVRPNSKVVCTLNCDGSVAEMRCADGHVKNLDLAAAKIVQAAAPFAQLDVHSPLRINLEVTFPSRHSVLKPISVRFKRYWKIVYTRVE